MQPSKGQKKFRMETRYEHNRSDGLTKRQSEKYAAGRPRARRRRS